ncbi:FAD-dependent oxidoreductase [Actinosynnema sp. NPDC020468]|uniref:FAD-dependent oxidoreductase n=1 Tax=Actinosynnema sp. NPDC020468 TaxID=3154488 RepID=UPI0033E70CC6
MSMDVVVIGAGQAGLSAAYYLERANLDYTVLDGEEGPGGAWRHRWPTLRMATVHGIHDLPGAPLAEPDPTAPANEVLPAYFADFERRNALRVRRPVHVSAVRDRGDLLEVETDRGRLDTRALINATGTWTRPFWPHYPGQDVFRGRQLHSSRYRGPEEFAGLRVVVVGGGTSAVQQLLEIAPTAAEVTWVTRREPVFRDEPFTPELGRAAVALVEERVRAGLPPRSVVGVTGLSLTPAVRAALETGVLDRKPMFRDLTEHTVRWADGHEQPADVILWATGFRAALDHLAPLNLRGPGGGIRLDGTRTDDPRVHLVGYGPSASTVGATRAGRAAVADLRRLLTAAPAR